jgi:hypothetical protein
VWDVFSDVLLALELRDHGLETQHTGSGSFLWFYAAVTFLVLPYVACWVGLGAAMWHRVTDWDNGMTAGQRAGAAVRYLLLGWTVIVYRDVQLCTTHLFNNFSDGSLESDSLR